MSSTRITTDYDDDSSRHAVNYIASKKLKDAFKKMEHSRKKLIQLLNNSHDDLKRNFYFLNWFLLITSAVDIIGTLPIAVFGLDDPRLCIVLEFSPALEFFSRVAEKVLSKRTKDKILKAIKEDEEALTRFKKLEELQLVMFYVCPQKVSVDIAKSIEPSCAGVDENLMSTASSFRASDVIIKKFSENRPFRDIAEGFANSEEGRLMIQRLLLDESSGFTESLNCMLSKEILKDLEDLNTEKESQAECSKLRSEIEKDEEIASAGNLILLGVEGKKIILKNKTILKICLSVVTMITAVYNLHCGFQLENINFKKKAKNLEKDWRRRERNFISLFFT